MKYIFPYPPSKIPDFKELADDISFINSLMFFLSENGSEIRNINNSYMLDKSLTEVILPNSCLLCLKLSSILNIYQNRSGSGDA
jgi:hypothetical protein